MSYSEDDLLPLSALAHLAYCERRAALIHLEQQWEENRFTVEGKHLHERADSEGVEVRGDVRTVRGLRICSYALGLSGRADVVEFLRAADALCQLNRSEGLAAAVALEGVKGLWRPFPVEYKRGRPKPGPYDLVQLCAQALCLEEMLGVAVPVGAMYYGQPRRRLDVVFDEALRDRTRALATRMHALFDAGATPAAEFDEAKCPRCSLVEVCQPKTVARGKSARRYVKECMRQIEDLGEGTAP